MTSALHQAVRRTIRRHQLCPPGTRLLIGLSGGSDSVALTLLMRDLSEHGGFEVVALAHFNHQLRETAARDEQFCREFAAAVGRPIEIASADVQAYAASQRLSVEDAGRTLRYDFLERAAAACGADRIAVGHTGDDQAETCLMKLARGAGPTGMGGIYPRKGNIVRPLLDVSRAALRAYLQAAGQGWIDDETNDDLCTPRNRIRHRVLPELEKAYGGAVRQAIARAAAVAREDGLWLDELAGRLFSALASRQSDGVHLDVAALAAEPLPLQRRVILLAARSVSDGREIGFDHVEQVIELLSGTGSGVDIPGSRVERRRKKLVILDLAPKGRLV